MNNENATTNGSQLFQGGYLGEKTTTKIKYDNILTTCENIRTNIISDLKKILDDYNEIYSKRNSIWQGIAADKYFVGYKTNFDRYDQYLTQYSLETYVKSVENLVRNNKSVDKDITMDEIAKINELVPIIIDQNKKVVLDGSISMPKINGVRFTDGVKEADNAVHASINTDKVAGQNDTSKVGAENLVHSSVNTETVSGQNDTTNVGSNNNVIENLNTERVEGQTKTANYVTSTNDIIQNVNSNNVEGQSDTISRAAMDQRINSNLNNLSDNSNLSKSQQDLMNDIFNLSGGDK